MPNYEELGFKAGLEIHQQLPGRKLFSNCPAEIRKDEHDFAIPRKLRVSAGEAGGVDQAALHERQKDKDFLYKGYNDSDSLVELDEEPPQSPDQEAIKTALTVAKLLNMKIVDGIQFMRKIVIDGSNVSGFQRTALIGYDGYVEVNGRRIGIESLCLEEEACQVIKRTEERDVYNLSRLGISLLEIATAPDIRSGEECQDVAEHLGMLLRSTERVKRGLGTIRQDVNVSIADGVRTEIKGFQDHRNIPGVVDGEVLRQEQLVQQGKPLEPGVRKAEEDNTTTFLRPMPGADRMYPETDVAVIEPDLEDIVVPETIVEREQRYVDKYHMSEDLAKKAVHHEVLTGTNLQPLYEEYLSEDFSANNITELAIIKVPEHIEENTWKEHRDAVLAAFSAGTIAYSSADTVLEDIAATDAFDATKFEQLSDDELRRIIQSIIAEEPGAPFGAYMGKIMRRTQGKADGETANKILREELN